MITLIVLGIILTAVIVLFATVVARNARRRADSVHALLVVVVSAFLGALYFGYLRSEPFPPDIVRVVPLLWLAGCAKGWILVAAALRFDNRKFPALAGLILNVPNTLLAGIFSLAAVMGG
jgi:uncharacterized membrane protein YoaK (UPF0700 family)